MRLSRFLLEKRLFCFCSSTSRSKNDSSVFRTDYQTFVFIDAADVQDIEDSLVKHGNILVLVLDDRVISVGEETNEHVDH
jgi:hypothetical protein